MVAKKKNNTEIRVPFFHDPAITIVLEIKFGKEFITPGTKIKLKGRRGQYTFTRLVVNPTKNVEWIDCISDATGEWVSVRPDKISGLVYKKSLAKKKNV